MDINLVANRSGSDSNVNPRVVPFELKLVHFESLRGIWTVQFISLNSLINTLKTQNLNIRVANANEVGVLDVTKAK